MAEAPLPQVPYKVPMLDDGGFLTQAWAGFYKQLFLRVGGSTAPSTSTISNSLQVLQGQIDDLQNDLAEQVSASDFNQGPIL